MQYNYLYKKKRKNLIELKFWNKSYEYNDYFFIVIEKKDHKFYSLIEKSQPQF